MSDLYLDLKHRIPVVTQWTTVGTQAMQDAQGRTGLSDERLARELHISAKTWTRWKKRGQIPTHDLQKVAPVLGFEIITPEPMPVVGERAIEPVVVTPDLRESLATMVGLLQSIAQMMVETRDSLARIERAMPSPSGEPRRASARS